MSRQISRRRFLSFLAASPASLLQPPYTDPAPAPDPFPPGIQPERREAFLYELWKIHENKLDAHDEQFAYIQEVIEFAAKFFGWKGKPFTQGGGDL